MTDAVRRVEHCRVCGTDDWLELLPLGEHPLANGFLEPAAEYAEQRYPIDVIVCRNCWLTCIRHVVDPDVLFADYVYVTSGSDQIVSHMRGVVELAVTRFGLRPGDLVVELGSNIGTQLRLFQDAGMRVAGVDPARNLVAIANADGVPSEAAFFDAGPAGRIATAQGRARFVLGRQCFAHIDDVHRVLDGVTTVLAEDGVLAIEVPYLLDLLDDTQFDTIYHEHLSYYSLGTLTELFGRHGLRVVDVARPDVHGGSILVLAAPDASPHQPTSAVAQLRELERTRGLDTERPYRQFADRVEHVVTELRALVRGLRAEGKVVAGYGAPSKGCALLQFAGLGPDDLAFCSDTTEGKQGRVTPGTHIPVWPPARGAAEPPDYYLLLAWNYAEEIVAKETAFLEGGGRFIVPIPQPRIVTGPDGSLR